jgi:hypothetical protein
MELTRGGSSRVEATVPAPIVSPGPIQVRRCRWILLRRWRVLWHLDCGYLVIAPGVRLWSPTRNRAINTARRIRSATS